MTSLMSSIFSFGVKSASNSRIPSSDAWVPSIWELKSASFLTYIPINRFGLGSTVIIPSSLANALSASDNKICNSSSNWTGGSGGNGLGIKAV